MNDNNNSVSLIADFDGDIRSLFDIEIGETLPLLPLRNMVLFPGIVIPVSIERSFSMKVIREAKKKDSYIGIVSQKDVSVDRPTMKDLFSIGTVAKVIRIIEMPDNRITALLQGFCRFKINKLIKQSPIYVAETAKLQETVFDKEKEIKPLSDACRDMMVKLIKINDPTNEAAFAIKNIQNNTFLINFIAANIHIPVKERIDLLRLSSEKARALKLLAILNREIQYESLKAKIQEKTREDLDQQQKEYFLQQQIKNIQNELGESPSDSEISLLKTKAQLKSFPENVRTIFNRELKKLERINPQSPDYHVQLNYLNVMLSLPWSEFTKDNLDLKNAEKVLNEDHYGLEKIKERILEYLAVIKLRGNLKSPILCLYGPPGVGKTSLGKSIARALKRKYVRVSLGGVHDESEIRGHRRTYVGAMPGRIIKNLAKCESNNPVFVLDEIDKISSQNINGDPSSALLEVLDPEQNNTFHDNFLDMDYDLSNILFIATANSLSSIPTPLLDRMELIEVSGYITEEKMQIAKKFLVPKEKENNGLGDAKKLKLSDAAIEKIIEQYTRESGVRQLNKTINKVFRKIAYKSVKDKQIEENVIKPETVVELLGQPPYIRDQYQGNDYAGVVTGLAWTSVGGEILYIETSLSKGKGGKLTLTGNLGDVMKESATLALEYVKAHAEALEIDHKIFDNWYIHIHVPEGATPKDGPSAGITIATSLASALTQRKIKERTAMTGEITLRGKVLPVGGIKEKILAAKRAGINTIILSKENKKDIIEINEIYLKGIKFEYVDNVEDVFKIALLPEKIEKPIDFTIVDKEETK